MPKNSNIQSLGDETGSATTFSPHRPDLAKRAVFGKKHNVSILNVPTGENFRISMYTEVFEIPKHV